MRFRLARGAGGFRHQAPEFLLADLPGDRVANLFKAGKVPEIRKIAALFRLHRLNRTVVAFEKNTFATGLVLQGKSLAIMPQVKKRLDKLDFAQTFEGGKA